MRRVHGLSRTDVGWLKRAALEASQAEGHYCLGAVIVNSGRLISFGYNKRRNDPAFVDVGWSVHAEVDALRRASSEAVEGATMYVARVTPGGRHALAKPCKACRAAAVRAGVTRLVYTTGTDAYAEKVSA